MSSYVYMKILESQPERPDRGIALMRMGQADRVKRRIVEDHVSADSRVLAIGVGTGTMALMAAKRGASVPGFEVSPAMPRVSRAKVLGQGDGFRSEQGIIQRQIAPPLVVPG